MANVPNKAVKKFTKPSHREIAAGILIAYGLFPRTNEGIAQAEKLIAGRETWLAPSNLPNYYDNIESDLMTGKETAGIVNIRMLLKEFYGLDDKPTGRAVPKLNTGNTTVYKPEDKFVDDKVEELGQKLDETSDKIMDMIDEFIAADKKRFEDFKRQEEEKVKQRIAGGNQYSEPIGPLPMQGPKEPPKKSSSSDDEWESEVNDQLGTKLDQLIEQVKNDPLPQASTKRRKTKGKTPIKRRKLLGESAGLSTTLSEILQNVSDTKQTLFDLYDVEKERFELRKTTDSNLTQLLKSKAREAGLEGTGLSGVDGKGNKEEKRKPTIVEKAAGSGLIAAAAALIIPMALTALRPLFQQDIKDADKDQEDVPPPDPVTDSPESAPVEQEPVAPVEEPESGIEPQPTTPQGAPELQPQPTAAQNAPSLQLPDTSIPGDYDYNPNAGVPLRAAAKGGKFTQGKHEKLKPIGKGDAKEPTGLKKLKKPLMSAVTLPLKAAAFGPLMLAKTVLSPFASFLPPPAVDFVKKIFDNVAKSAGLSGFDFSITSAGKGLFEKLIELIESIFKPIFDLFKGKSPNTSDPGPDVPSDAASSSSSRASSSGATKTGAAFSTSAGQDKFVTEIYNAAQQSGAKHPIIAAAIASLETGFGKNEYDNAPFNQRNPDGSFKKYNSRAEAAADFVKLWDKSHGGYKNLDQYDDPLEAFKAIVHAYAPASDGNNPDSYIQFVSNFISTYKDKLGKTPPKPPVKPTPPEPRPRPQSRSEQIRQKLAERNNKQPKATKPTVPVGTTTEKQPGA